MQTQAGTLYEHIPKSILEVSPEERILTLEELWQKGNFHNYAGTFQDVHTDKRANEMVYAFWREKVRDRIDDPTVQDILAPSTPRNAIGVRHYPCLEQGFYEAFNQDNVQLVDLKENPIVEVVPGGVRMNNGTEHELDVLVLATGYDQVTGPMKQIDIRGKDGVLIRDKWEKKGLLTFLGLMSVGYPNLFFPFGPQGPTGVAVGPSIIVRLLSFDDCLLFPDYPLLQEIQGAWIVECLQHLRKNDFTHIEPTGEAEVGWRRLTQELYAVTLEGQESKIVGGQLAESRNFVGGLPMYGRLCRESVENGYNSFVLSKLV
jgi:hypothetical protein